MVVMLQVTFDRPIQCLCNTSKLYERTSSISWTFGNNQLLVGFITKSSTAVINLLSFVLAFIMLCGLPSHIKESTIQVFRHSGKSSKLDKSGHIVIAL